MGPNMFATKFVVACSLYSTFTEIEKSHSFWVRKKDKSILAFKMKSKPWSANKNVVHHFAITF